MLHGAGRRPQLSRGSVPNRCARAATLESLLAGPGVDAGRASYCEKDVQYAALISIPAVVWPDAVKCARIRYLLSFSCGSLVAGDDAQFTSSGAGSYCGNPGVGSANGWPRSARPPWTPSQPFREGRVNWTRIRRKPAVLRLSRQGRPWPLVPGQGKRPQRTIAHTAFSPSRGRIFLPAA